MNKFQPQGKVKLVKGSILAPENAGLRFVLSLNNLAGKSESNPLYPIFEKKWKKVKEEAKGWYATKTGAYKLGAINVTAVQSDTWVIHMLCQDENLKLNASALEDCLKQISAKAKYEQASVHVSSILLETIPEIKDMLTKHIVANGTNVSIYEEK
jgi:hypothetical protein